MPAGSTPLLDAEAQAHDDVPAQKRIFRVGAVSKFTVLLTVLFAPLLMQQILRGGGHVDVETESHGVQPLFSAVQLGGEDPVTLVKSYLKHRKKNDIPGCLSYLADDIEFQEKGIFSTSTYNGKSGVTKYYKANPFDASDDKFTGSPKVTETTNGVTHLQVPFQHYQLFHWWNCAAVFHVQNGKIQYVWVGRIEAAPSLN